jgi:hypothetical protein
VAWGSGRVLGWLVPLCTVGHAQITKIDAGRDRSVDLCLLHLLRGVILRLLAFPEPHVVVPQGEADPRGSVKPEEWARQARAVRSQDLY